MKMILAALFLFVFSAGLCHAEPSLSICFDAEGNPVPCTPGKLLPEAASGDSGKGNALPGSYNSSSLTYAHLGEDPSTPSEILRGTQAVILPAPDSYHEPFVSLEQDARRQEFWPWRDVVESGPRKLRYNFALEDATGRGSVRVFHAKIGVEYEVSPNTAFGVEGIGGIQDSQDAEAWGKSAREEKAAQVKYKIFF